ncbi:MAG: gamma-glutamylcyclotransferase [Opitutales bacterium]|nr:gamma-glutamylcyclotransferase [Opitutales bacterium]
MEETSPALPPARFHVFVYGTLRPGGFYARKLCLPYPHRYTPAVVDGRLYHLKPGYPGLTRGADAVRGEVLSFDDPTLLRDLDRLEDYHADAPPARNLYIRECAEARDPATGHPLGEVLLYRMTEDRVRQYGGVYLSEAEWSVDRYSGEER